MGRFINADSYASTGQGILGNNMFAYCGNKPVSGFDPCGYADVNFEQISIQDSYAGSGLAVVVAGAGLASLLLRPFLYLMEEVEELIQDLQQIQISASEPAGDYTVYFLCEAGDSSRTIIYVGRVKSANFESRMAYHQKLGREYVDCITNLSYELCRAYEQAGMMYYHTINRDSALNNQIRGISPANSKRHLYFALAMEVINRGIYPDNLLLPYSYWENLTENEFLNATP